MDYETAVQELRQVAAETAAEALASANPPFVWTSAILATVTAAVQAAYAAEPEYATVGVISTVTSPTADSWLIKSFFGAASPVSLLAKSSVGSVVSPTSTGVTSAGYTYIQCNLTIANWVSDSVTIIAQVITDTTADCVDYAYQVADFLTPLFNAGSFSDAQHQAILNNLLSYQQWTPFP